MPDKKQALYDGLKKKGLYNKSYDEFVQQYSDQDKVEKLYQGMASKGLYSKNITEFTNQFFSDIKKKNVGQGTSNGSKPSESGSVPFQTPTDIFNGQPDQPLAPTILTPEKQQEFIEANPVVQESLQPQLGLGNPAPVDETQLGSSLTQAPDTAEQFSTERKITPTQRLIQEALTAYRNAQGEEASDAILNASQNKQQETIGATTENEGSTPGILYNKFLKGTGSLANALTDAVFSVGKYLPINDEYVESGQLQKDYRADYADNVRNFLKDKIGADVDKGAEVEFDEGFVSGAVGGLVESAPAILGAGATMGGTLFAQAYDYGLQAVEAQPNSDQLDEDTKTIYAATLGSVVSALEKYGLNKVIKGSGVSNGITKKIINSAKESGQKITGEVLDELIDKNLKGLANKFSKVGYKAFDGFAVEAATGGAQEVAAIASEDLLNKATGKPIFDTSEATKWKGFIERVGRSAGQEGIGGGIMGTGVGILTSSRKQKLAKNQNLLSQIDEQLDNPELSETSKEVLVQKKIKLQDDMENQAELELAQQAKYTPEEKEKAVRYNENIDKLEQTINDPAVPDEIKIDLQEELAKTSEKLVSLNETVARRPKPENETTAPTIEATLPEIEQGTVDTGNPSITTEAAVSETGNGGKGAFEVNDVVNYTDESGNVIQAPVEAVGENIATIGINQDGVYQSVEVPINQIQAIVEESPVLFKLGEQDKFYHASQKKRVGRLKPGSAPQFGEGVYFSTNKDLVRDEFGNEVSEVELAISKPLNTNSKEYSEVVKQAIENYKKENLTWDEDSDGWIDKNGKNLGYDPDLEIGEKVPVKYLSDTAKELGFDAIIDEGSSTYDNEIVVLDETKIIYPEDKPSNEQAPTPTEATEQVLPKQGEPQAEGVTVEQDVEALPEKLTESESKYKDASPEDLAKAYDDEVTQPTNLNEKERAIAEYPFGISREGFIEADDINNITSTIARNYFARKNESKDGKPAAKQFTPDQIAKAINDKVFKAEVLDEGDIVEFIKRFPNGPESIRIPSGNPTLQAINDAYFEKTGKKLNRKTAKEIATKHNVQEEKITDIVNNDKIIEDISSLFEPGPYGKPDWNAIEKQLNDNEGFFTSFPGSMSKEEVEALKRLIENERQATTQNTGGETGSSGQVSGPENNGTGSATKGGETNSAARAAESWIDTRAAELAELIKAAKAKIEKELAKLSKGNDMFAAAGVDDGKKNKSLFNEATNTDESNIKRIVEPLQAEVDRLTQERDNLLSNKDQIIAESAAQQEMFNEQSPEQDAKIIANAFNPFTEVTGTINKFQEEYIARNTRKVEDWIANEMNIWGQSKNWLKRNASHIATSIFNGIPRSKENISGKLRLTGGFNMARFNASKLSKQLYDIIGNDPQKLEEVHKLLDPEVYGITPPASGQLLIGQGKDVQMLYDELRSLLDDIHRRNFALGFINKETYDKFKGKYVPRLYQTFEIPADVQEMLDEQDKYHPVTKLDLGQFKRRKEFDDLSQEAKDDVLKDPVYGAVKRLMQLDQNAAIAGYINQIITDSPHLVITPKTEAKKEAKAPATYSGTNNNKGLVRLDANGKEIQVEEKGLSVIPPPETGLVVTKGDTDGKDIPPGYQLMSGKGYGKLDGKYVPNYIAEDFKGFFMMNETMNKMYDWFKAYDKVGMRQFLKKSYTVFNPVVQLGNFVSNFTFAFSAGIDPVSFAAGLRQAAKELNNEGADFQTLMRNGILGSDIVSQDLLPQQALNGLSKSKQPLLVKAWNKFDEKTSELYGKSDDLAKMNAFLIFKEQGFTEQEAIQKVYEGFQNYATVGKMWDLTSKTPFIGNPFIKFQADLFRIMKNGVFKTPLTTSMYLSALYTMPQLLELVGLADEEEDKERDIRTSRSFIPKVPLGITDIPLVYKTRFGEVNLARYLSPFFLFDTGKDEGVNNLAKKFLPVTLIEKEEAGKGNVTTSISLADPLLGTLTSALFSDTDFRGKSIKDPEATRFRASGATTEEEIANKLTFLGRAWIPQGAQIHDLHLSNKYGEDFYGRTRTGTQAIINLFVKVQDWKEGDYKKEAQKRLDVNLSRLKSLSDERKNIGANILKKIENANTDSNEGRISEQQYNERMDKFRSEALKRLDHNEQQTVKLYGDIEKFVSDYKEFLK